MDEQSTPSLADKCPRRVPRIVYQVPGAWYWYQIPIPGIYVLYVTWYVRSSNLRRTTGKMLPSAIEIIVEAGIIDTTREVLKHEKVR